MLSLIAEKLMARGLVGSTWAGEMQVKGELVKLYRDYYDGIHRLKLTKEMRQMMQINSDRLDQYNANYCEMVIAALADRLTVESVDVTIPTPNPSPQGQGGEQNNAGQTAQEAADGWVKAIMTQARFDSLQIDVREAATRDGETFVMVEFEDADPILGTKEYVRLAHEPAWDGDYGTMVVYDSQVKTILAGIKIWYECDSRFVNIYYPNSMERFSYEVPTPSPQGGEQEKSYLKARDDEPIDTTREGRIPGVPLIHFPNRGKRKAKSELVNMIPLNDSLNSTLVSMVMSALFTGFSVLFANFDVPNGITPGMIIKAQLKMSQKAADGSTQMVDMASEDVEVAKAIAAQLTAYKLERIEAGNIDALIKQADWLIYQIGTISSTPVPGQMGGDSSSGEALKQRSIGLVGKAQRAQVQFGNAWKDVFALGARLHTLYGTTQPPAGMQFTTRWKSEEIRNNVEILSFAKQMHEMGFTREAIRLMSQANVKEYTEDAINTLLAERAEDEQAKNTAAVANLPQFGALEL